jgi:hypothetical protein
MPACSTITYVVPVVVAADATGELSSPATVAGVPFLSFPGFSTEPAGAVRDHREYSLSPKNAAESTEFEVVAGSGEDP